MLSKEGKSIPPQDHDIQMPFNKHEIGVIRQRLKPDIFFPTLTEGYRKLKRRVLYERPKLTFQRDR
jgi:hypothetical protein